MMLSKQKIENYSNSLSLTSVIRDRINTLISLNAKIIDSDILDIFISEIEDDEMNRTYTSLWFFTNKYIIECKQFQTVNDLDIMLYREKIHYCKIMFREFDSFVATEKSFVKIYCGVNNDMKINLLATGKNCEKAFEIYQKYFVNNLN